MQRHWLGAYEMMVGLLSNGTSDMCCVIDGPLSLTSSLRIVFINLSGMNSCPRYL